MTAVEASGTADTLLYTVPTDRTAIVKDLRLRVFNTGRCVIYGLDPSGNAVLLIEATASGGGTETVVEERGAFVCLLEGTEVRCTRATTAGTALVWLSGALLDGDPT